MTLICLIIIYMFAKFNYFVIILFYALISLQNSTDLSFELYTDNTI